MQVTVDRTDKPARSGPLRSNILVPASRKIGDLRSNHAALSLIKMPTLEVEACDVSKRITATIEMAMGTFSPSFLRCTETVTAVENFSLKENDTLSDTVLTNVRRR
jgi:hypothetical protein